MEQTDWLIFLCIYWQLEIEAMLKNQDYKSWAFALAEHTKARKDLLKHRNKELYFLYDFQLN